MPSAQHDLGELEHIYDSQNLKLVTHGFVTISSSQLFEIPLSINFEDLEALVSSSTWVAGGNRLQLLVHVSFDNVMVPDSDTARVTEDLGVVLCNAAVWPQLYLDASLSLPRGDSDFSNHSNTISISLTRQASSQSATKPPDGVPSVCIESIDLAMYFSPCRFRRVLVGDSHLEMGVMQGTTETNFGQERPHEMRGSPMLPHDFSRMNADDLRRVRPWKLCVPTDDNDAPLVFSASASTATSPTNSQNSVSSKLSITSRTESLRSFCSIPIRYHYAKHEVRFEDLVKVMDASLHTIISDSMPTRYSGKGGRQAKDVPIILSNDEGRPKIATISPVLFSPGYHEVKPGTVLIRGTTADEIVLQVISQHAPLLSTIAHTMCSISHHTKAMNLSRKIRQLQNLPPDRYSNADPAISTAAGDIYYSLAAAIKARLWFLAQRKLIDPLACRRLKQLDATKTSPESDSASQDILDESTAPSDEVEQLFDSEDTNPFAEFQDFLLDDDRFQDDNLFDGEDVQEAEAFDDDLLMDGEAILDDQGAHENVFWEGLDCDEDIPYISQALFGHLVEREHLHEGHQHLLDPGMEYILDEHTDTVHDDTFAESHSGGICPVDDMLEDAEMRVA